MNYLTELPQTIKKNGKSWFLQISTKNSKTTIKYCRPLTQDSPIFMHTDKSKNQAAMLIYNDLEKNKLLKT